MTRTRKPAKEEPWINELEEIYSEASAIYEMYASENMCKLKELKKEMRRKFNTLTKKKTSLEKMFNSLIGQTEELLMNKTEINGSVPTLRKNERASANLSRL